MIRSRSFLVLGALSIVALAGFAGCDRPAVDDDEATETAVSELNEKPAAPAKQGEKGMRGDHAGRGHHGRPGGPAMLLGAALHELDLTDAQKTTIQAEMDALRDGAGKPDMDAHRTALAEAVRSGNVDVTALKAQVAPKAPDTSRLAKAIGVLHDTLTQAQREQLVAAISDRMEKGPKGPPGDHEGPPGDREGGSDGEAKAHHKEFKKGGRGAFGPMGHMLKDLDLSDVQREKVKEALSKLAPTDADREAMKAQHEAFQAKMKERLATFATASFDANAFVTPPEGGKHGPDKMFGHMVESLAAVVPILTEAQRTELAKRIEEGHGGPRGHR
ncbi:MAG: hypothetical protein IPK82_21785 [Polyangiaceae bacterium]|nr:hypothetical protein [Polyangiaceae bacterium]